MMKKMSLLLEQVVVLLVPLLNIIQTVQIIEAYVIVSPPLTKTTTTATTIIPFSDKRSKKRKNQPLALSSSPLSEENEASSYNDAFLDTLENIGGGGGGSIEDKSKDNNNSSSSSSNINIDPSPDSLAALRDIATSNVANFLATFSHPPEASTSSTTGSSTDSDENIVYNNNEGKNRRNRNVSIDGSAAGGDGSIIDSGSGYELPSSIQTNQEPKEIHWDVYVCQSKQCLERGSAATLDSFQALVPTNPISVPESNNNDFQDSNNSNTIITTINVHPAILSRSKAKGPNVRCIQRTPPYTSFEVNNVNDIDKVYRILTKHMSITNISKQAKECLKYTYQGNSHLEKNELSDAIRSYSIALDQDYKSQEGMLLLLRATAYLKRAFQHQEILRETVVDLGNFVADPMVLGKLYSVAEQNPNLAKAIFQKVISDTKAQDKKFRLTKYRHGLYEYSLLHAAQDSLRSTQLLPHHAKTWLRAGDALAELRKLKESALYYEKAMELDPTLRARLEPVIERLNRSQEFLDRARGWWSSDTLRLALDVAGG